MLPSSDSGQHAVQAGDRHWSMARMAQRRVRYRELVPCFNAFVDCRTPGSEAKENFTIIGPGVSENPDQHVHMTEPHGFNIGGARQPPGCVNSQHSHDTAEVFVIHSGTWRFDMGEFGDDARIDLVPGDVISIPTKVFRGFTATGPADDGTPGFLWAVLGQDNPGRVTWAPQVFDMARDYGLVLLENGSLVDIAAGESLPPGAAAMAPTTREEADSLTKMTPAQVQSIVSRNHAGQASHGGGGYATPIIGNTGPLDWDHGFLLDRIDIASGRIIAWDGCGRKEVLFVHRGSVDIACDDGVLTLAEGDTISLPVGWSRQLFSSGGAVAFVVWQ